MISSSVFCIISVFVSNFSCLALSSFFASILPSKRNLLTQLNTVLVFVMTAMVNVMVRWNKNFPDMGSKPSFTFKKVSKSSSRCDKFFFLVWQHPDRGHIPTLNTSDNDSPASILLAFVSNASPLCCTQPHKDVPHIQGE